VSNATALTVSQAVHPTPEQIKQMVEIRKEIGHAMRAWRATQWGEDLEEGTLRALGAWANKHGLDHTEIEVLGGKPYINASFYLRKLAEIDPHAIEYAVPDHVHLDPRLVEAMNEEIPEDVDEETRALIVAHRRQARQEHYRRLAQRTAFNLPDTATAAVVYRLKLRGMDREFVGADWCGNKGTKKIKRKDGGTFDKAKDPVGDEEPVKTAETRAARRCLRQAVSAFPTLKAQMERVDADVQAIAATVQAELAPVAVEPRALAAIKDGTETGGDVYDTSEAPIVSKIDELNADKPRTKAQIFNLMQVLAGPEWSDEERAEAEDWASNATYGEMEAKTRWAKQETLARRKAAATPTEEAA
jgi:hypothetical protein